MVPTIIAMTKPRGRVERVDGWTNGDYVDSRPTVTWRVYLDGKYLGNAYTEDEGWRWIADMKRFHAEWGAGSPASL